MGQDLSLSMVWLDPLLQGLSQAEIKVAVWAGVSAESWAGEGSGQMSPSVPWHLSFPNMVICLKPSSQESDQKSQLARWRILCNTITEVPSHPLYCILLVRSKPRALPAPKGRELLRAWTPRGENTVGVCYAAICSLYKLLLPRNSFVKRLGIILLQISQKNLILDSPLGPSQMWFSGSDMESPMLSCPYRKARQQGLQIPGIFPAQSVGPTIVIVSFLGFQSEFGLEWERTAGSSTKTPSRQLLWKWI